MTKPSRRIQSRTYFPKKPFWILYRVIKRTGRLSNICRITTDEKEMWRWVDQDASKNTFLYWAEQVNQSFLIGGPGV